MRTVVFVFFILLVITSSVVAQDVIYTTGGNKLQAKVLEINTTSVKYKDYSNLDGPTYVIIKTDVVLIKYYNGMTEVINSNPLTIGPKSETTAINNIRLSESAGKVEKDKSVEKAPFNLYYLNNNMLSINALALANGDVTLMYDRDLFNSRMSLTFLGGYSFNNRMGGLNAFIADSKDNAKKKYDLGFGINFMPRNTKRVQYFVGLLGKYMTYDYQNVIDTTNNQKNYEKASAFQMAVMLTNGWIFRVSPNFNFKLFGAIGAPGNSVPLKSQYTGVPKVYLGYCFGYRF
jgi:hypothetical protein